MALEAFLINPAKRRKRKASGARKRKGGGLPGGLLSRMIRTYGIKRGMKEAWKAHRSGKRNPFGEEVMIVGNPRGRRKKVRKEVISTMATRRRRVRRKRVRRNEPGRKRVHHQRRYSLLGNDPGRRTYRRRIRRNEPARRHRRRYSRRNPASTGLAISARRPMSLLMPAAVGAGGYFAADYIPIAIGMSATPMTRIGIKAAIAVGGGMLLSRFLGARNATAFSLGVGINVLNDVLRTYVFKTTTTTAGLGAFVRPGLRGDFGAFTPSPYARPANYRS